ncbi:MAG: hypothetical protein QXS54_07625 [Candidatus Methanomethylicaceae archaeon]
MNEASYFMSIMASVVMAVSGIAAWLIKKQIADISDDISELREHFDGLRTTLFDTVKDHERRIATIEGIIKRGGLNGH